MKPSQEGFWVLAGGTLLSLWFLVNAFTSSDAEGKLACAAIGGIGAAFTAPFWLIYRGRIPFLLIAMLGAIGMFGALEVNALAAKSAGTSYVHLRDYTYLLWFTFPGIAYAIYSYVRGRSASNSTTNGPAR